MPHLYLLRSPQLKKIHGFERPIHHTTASRLSAE